MSIETGSELVPIMSMTGMNGDILKARGKSVLLGEEQTFFLFPLPC